MIPFILSAIPFIFFALPFVITTAIILHVNLSKDVSISATPALVIAQLSPVKPIASKRFELAVASPHPLSASTLCPPSRPLLNLRPVKPIEVSRPVIRDDDKAIKRFGNLSVKGLAPRLSSATSTVRLQMTTLSQPTVAVVPTETISSLEKLSIAEPAPRSRPRKADPTRRKKEDPEPIVGNGGESSVSSLSGTHLSFDALQSSFERLTVRKESAPKSILRSSSSTTVCRQKKTVHFNTLPTDCDVIFSEIRYFDVARIKHKVQEEERHKTYANTHTPHIFGGRFVMVYQGKLCLMKEQGHYAPPSIKSDEALVCKAILKGRPCQHQHNSEGVELAEL